MKFNPFARKKSAPAVQPSPSVDQTDALKNRLRQAALDVTSPDYGPRVADAYLELRKYTSDDGAYYFARHIAPKAYEMAANKHGSPQKAEEMLSILDCRQVRTKDVFASYQAYADARMIDTWAMRLHASMERDDEYDDYNDYGRTAYKPGETIEISFDALCEINAPVTASLLKALKNAHMHVYDIIFMECLSGDYENQGYCDKGLALVDAAQQYGHDVYGPRLEDICTLDAATLAKCLPYIDVEAACDKIDFKRSGYGGKMDLHRLFKTLDDIATQNGDDAMKVKCEELRQRTLVRLLETHGFKRDDLQPRKARIALDIRTAKPKI